MSKRFIGLPCVGGKSRLVDILAKVIEEQAEKGNIRECVDCCGGGGKIALSLDHKKFDRLVYNECEYGVATLMNVLKEADNINLINTKVHSIIDRALALGSIKDKESICKALFNVARDYVVCNQDSHKDLDPIIVAALTTIVVYGSVHNNRRTLGYKRFELRLMENLSYLKTFRSINSGIKYIECLNMDCFELIEKHYNNPNVLLVIDCPYYNSVNSYAEDWDYIQHKRLVKACKNARCKVLICMNDKGIAPYWNLIKEQNWHFYKSAAIIHDSKKSDVDILKNKDLSNLKESMGIEYGTQLIKTLYIQSQLMYDNEVNYGQLTKTVQEYIVCNFEVNSLEEYKGEVSPYMVTEYSPDAELNESVVGYKSKDIDAYYVLKEKAEKQILLEKKKKIARTNKKVSGYEEQIIEMLGLPRY